MVVVLASESRSWSSRSWEIEVSRVAENGLPFLDDSQAYKGLGHVHNRTLAEISAPRHLTKPLAERAQVVLRTLDSKSFPRHAMQMSRAVVVLVTLLGRVCAEEAATACATASIDGCSSAKPDETALLQLDSGDLAASKQGLIKPRRRRPSPWTW